MIVSNFLDKVLINVKSGKGGEGSAHLRRAKFLPKGGPDGGDGGSGGNIYVVGNKFMSTLLHLRYTKHIFAENGENGSKDNKFGKNGKDITIQVPIGTVCKNADTCEFLFEIVNHDEKFLLAKGGRGGRGNVHFKSSTNQTPRYSQKGEALQEFWIELELKLLADVGLVGMPNAGKSTILSVVSAAKPKIANYPFTTLIPQLGIVNHRNENTFVMADIPGIIEGASIGKGMGFDFLRHIQRNSVLLFVVSSESENVKEDYFKLLNEVVSYDKNLLEKERFLVVTKNDLLDEKKKEKIEKSIKGIIEYLFISSIAMKNLEEMKDILWKKILKSRNF